MGEASAEEIKLRSGAQPGDLIAVTGWLGSSLAGLTCLQSGGAISENEMVSTGSISRWIAIVLTIAAFVLGARVIEKHFTLNHTWKGTDHAFSLEPIGLRKMVRDLRRLRVAMGDGVKKVYETEKSPITKMGKKLVKSESDVRRRMLMPNQNDILGVVEA